MNRSMCRLVCFPIILVLATSIPSVARGQPKLSPDELKKLQDYKDRLPPPKNSGELSVGGLSVSASGTPTNVDAKVIQVIDKGTMLVGLEDSRTATGRYSTWVMLKAPTAGIVDGASWRGSGWKDKVGSDILSVTGTTTYKTVTGTKTVFVVEPGAVKPPVEGKDGGAKQPPPVKETGKKDADAKQFVGQWRMVEEKGAVGFDLTLSDSFTAKNSHVPDAVGVWEIVGDEVRITWSDGWKDILRPEKDGVVKIAFGPKTTFTDKPVNTQKAVKESAK